MKQRFSYNEIEHTIELTQNGNGFEARTGEQVLSFTVRELGGGRIELVFPDRSVILETAIDGDVRWVAMHGRMYELRRESRSRKRSRGGADLSEGSMRAPMPGQVRAVSVSVGDQVTRGQVLLVLEAMKMEIRIQSPVEGVVVALPVSEGEQVDKGQVVVEVAG